MGHGICCSAARPAAAAIALLLLAASPSSSSNLLLNPEFDVDVSSWELISGTDQLVADANGCATSKAVSSFSFPDPENGATKIVQYVQCVALGEPLPATLFGGFSYRSVVDVVFGKLRFFSDSACTEESLLSESETELPQGADFTVWQRSIFSAAVPEGTGSVQVRLEFAAVSLGYFVRVDSALLVEADPIFLSDFERGSTCPWLVPILE
jgi:hypothetical protein